jgi:hypothetical protein
MKLKDALQNIQEHVHLISIYEEVIDHLENYMDKIPVPTQEGVADPALVARVVEEAQKKKTEHEKAILAVENMEVSNGTKRGSSRKPGASSKPKRKAAAR